ncbi:hypothetical protein BFF78_08095 [Streptomyces fodineus]|uniref:Uncharacterized protein n=1 Tax=Streptomyces fodineus TaxID=1904616 RepID=A0A1D7Y5W3_9ACTN|nr:hypothetical protein [Streptomyces fodineus]AOR31007.1 hypothetical protein BFF78_08095 [Streptomyces fodineus]
MADDLAVPTPGPGGIRVLVTLAAILAFCVGGFFLLPAGRTLIERPWYSAGSDTMVGAGQCRQR